MITLFILAVIPWVGSAQQSSCPTKYTRFSTQHSFCIARNPTCSIIKEGVNGKDKMVILQVHNGFRSKVASGQESRGGGLPTASDMLQMDWDPELAAIAQNWAAQCKFEHDCNDCRTVEKFKVGQNIAVEYLSTCSSNDCTRQAVKPAWKAMITGFYNEISLFDKKYISPFRIKSGFGHFSQMVWAKSWKIGCGYVAFNNANGITKLYVCNYGPSGNFLGESMYEPGKTCSGCPSNTSCGTCEVQEPTYSGLCC